ncbi:MAG: hypothetical protein KDG58_17790, partial [Anaerolineae bacterium]|nr:hypothetical protein [Anaerolineae bacterium]
MRPLTTKHESQPGRLLARTFTVGETAGVASGHEGVQFGRGFLCRVGNHGQAVVMVAAPHASGVRNIAESIRRQRTKP